MSDYVTINPHDRTIDRLIFVGLMDTYGVIYMTACDRNVADYVVHETLAEAICIDRGWAMGPHGYKETLYRRGWALLSVQNHDNYIEAMRLNNDQMLNLFDLYNRFRALPSNRRVEFALDGIARAVGMTRKGE